MKKKSIKFLPDIRTSVILLFVASFLTVSFTVLQHESDFPGSWLRSFHSIFVYAVKVFLILLWSYPSLSLLYVIYRNNNWKETLSVLIGMLLLFFVTATVVRFLLNG